MRKFLFLSCLIIILLTGMTALYSQGNSMLDDWVVAVVDNEIILLSDLRSHTLQYAAQMGVNPRENMQEFVKLMEQVLEQLIIQKVLYVKGIEDSVVVENRHVEDLLNQQVNQLVMQYGSREKVKEIMGSPIEKIKRDWEEIARQSLMAKMVREKKEMNIQVNRREVIDFYKNNKDSLPDLPESLHIANLLVKIKAGEESKSKAKARIESIYEQIKNGADFQKIAREYSDDPGSAAAGGELGFFQRGELVKEFEEVAYQLQPGELSEIVESSHGYHIIQLIERQGDKINCRHILAKPEPTKEDELLTVNLIKEIHQKLITKQATFEELVKQYSEDETSKDNNGDLGWWEKNMVQLKEFRYVLKDLKAGEVSEPVKTQLGYHILKLIEVQASRPVDLTLDWDRIENFALQTKRQREMKRWVDKLKENVYISKKEIIVSR